MSAGAVASAAFMMTINTDSRDSLLDYDHDNRTQADSTNHMDNNHAAVDDEDNDDDDDSEMEAIFGSSSSEEDDGDSDDGGDNGDSGEEEKQGSDINDSGLGNGDTAENNNELKCAQQAIQEVMEGGGVTGKGGATLE